jgi:uncharacterized protein with HEPN domain
MAAWRGRFTSTELGHMLDVVKRVMAKTATISREPFDADENLRLALTHLLQTIGEAARRISRELQAEHPEMPRPAIIGMRHKVVHDYMGVDEEVVRRTARDEVPRLYAALEKLGVP